MLDQDGLTIKQFYAPVGSTRVTYDKMSAVYEEDLNFWSGKWRFGGPRRLPQWFHVDWWRPGKEKCIVVETTELLDPLLTPEHHTRVLAILRQHEDGARRSCVASRPPGRDLRAGCVYPHICM